MKKTIMRIAAPLAIAGAIALSGAGAASAATQGWLNPGGGVWVSNGDGSATITYSNGDSCTTSVENLQALGLREVTVGEIFVN
jgi:hypothetical protein